jgi:hypothetical protein
MIRQQHLIGQSERALRKERSEVSAVESLPERTPSARWAGRMGTCGFSQLDLRR